MAYTASYSVSDYKNILFDLLGTSLAAMVPVMPDIVQLSMYLIIFGLGIALIGLVFKIVRFKF